MGRAVYRTGLMALVLVVLLVAVFRVHDRGGPRPPNVVVVVVDTLRADELGVLGGPPGLTPFLDELARRSVVFSNAYAASGWTNPSVASLFTSRYPSQHLVRAFESRLVAGEVTLAERLSRAGYLALGLSGNIQLARDAGWGQGFQRWRTFPETFKVRLSELARETLSWVDATWSRGGTRPLFLYVQPMDPHAPYEPPSPFAERFAPEPPGGPTAVAVNEKLQNTRWRELTPADVARLRALYQAEIAYTDAQLRALFAGLEARGVLDDAIVVLTADHGEEFMEHGVMAHGLTLFNQAMRVPLLVSGPGIPRGGLVSQPVSLVDLAPTLLDRAGLAPEARFEGRSLRPFLERGAGPERDVVAQLPPWAAGPDWRQHRAAMVRRSLKILFPGEAAGGLAKPRAYDLARDPSELFPDPDRIAVQRLVLIDALHEILARLAGKDVGVAQRAPIDPARREKLRALGYVQ